ncbi:MAG: hypothetical protein WCT41_02565 [Candidatus Paceibacterota bacterium]|jgi:hypothetical protein
MADRNLINSAHHRDTKNVVFFLGYSLAEDPNIPRNTIQYIGSEGTHQDLPLVCWGDKETGALGRLPMTIWLAQHIAADRIIWSSGSSRIKDGLYESEFFLDMALKSFSALKRDFPHRFNDAMWADETVYKQWLESRSICDTKSQFTQDGLVAARNIIADTYNTNSVMFYAVSSANHAPRVLRDAFKVFEGLQSKVTVCSVAAETCYGGATIKDTIVDDLGRFFVPKSH